MESRGEQDMFLIVGLGNPTKQYEKTRHNIGFDVMDALADKYNISISENKHKALCGKGVIEGMKVVLAKPQTYMNLSGESVAELVNYYKLDPESELIVVFDDISWKKLVKYNDLQRDYTLVAGDIIYLKSKKKKASKPHTVYIVKDGDSMHAISQKYGIRLKNLYKMNRKDGEYIPEVGDRLRLR